MALAEEPCIFQYFIYLAKKKSSLDEASINEAQELWDKLCTTFEMKDDSARLIRLIEETNKTIYFDKSVKRLITLKTGNDMAFAEQILAHDTLVLCFVLNSQKDLKTDKPYLDWAKLLEKVAITNELKYIYDSGTVLQTITNEPQQMAELVQKELPSFSTKPLRSSILDCGKLWRFGFENRYLLTIDRAFEEKANNFLGYSFTYILTLLSKIQNHYSLAVKLYENISEKEKQVNEYRDNLEEITKTNDTTILEEKRNDLRGISNETTDNLTYLKDCGVNIQNNIINLKGILKDLKIVQTNDKIFSDSLELFEEHVQNINAWATVCEGSLSRINKATSDMREILKERIDRLTTTCEISEFTSTSASKIQVDWGNYYLINESELRKSVNIFEEILKLEIPGLSITQTHPKKIKKGRNLDNVRMYWLSNTSCKFCLSPALEKIEHEITKYLTKNKQSVFLFEGLEHLIINNDFNKVLKLVDYIKELVSLHNSILLVPLSFSAFSGKEISLIMKNMKDITDVKVDIEALKNITITE